MKEEVWIVHNEQGNLMRVQVFSSKKLAIEAIRNWVKTQGTEANLSFDNAKGVRLEAVIRGINRYFFIQRRLLDDPDAKF